MINHENKPDGATHYIQGALYDPSYIQYLKKVEGGYSPWSYMREQWMHTVTVKTIAKYGRAIRVIEK